MTNTTWGEGKYDHDTRTLERYSYILSLLNKGGDILQISLLIGLFAFNIWFIANVEFEVAVFHDGSHHMCTYQKNSNEIVPVDK